MPWNSDMIRLIKVARHRGYICIKTENMEIEEQNLLDVRIIEPRLKHPTIFRCFDELSDGETLTILNDHDPKPLYYQLLNERGDIFVWKYLEDGPERWKVIITKGKGHDKTVGEIAASDWRKAQVFKKYGIDFCCGGKRTLKEVCRDKQLDEAELERELGVTAAASFRALPFNEWSLDFLADYIVNTHHTYVERSLPELLGFARKVAMVHGEFHPELPKIARLVEVLADELMNHMRKEENILFPYVRDLVRSTAATRPHFGTVANPISVMEHEHDDAGRILAEIRELSGGYTIPADACTSYSLLYKMLDEFEQDLHTHIHLENNILFPKALELEKSANRAAI